MAGASQELARFIAATEFRDLPEDVIQRTAELVLDHVGVAVHGSTTPWARMVTDLVAGDGCGGKSSIYASSQKTSARNAALANGTMAHSFELDDTLGVLHPGAVVIPAALAVGEQQHCRGTEVVTAIVLGYEVMSRVGAAIHDTKVFHRGHHGTGITGSFGASVAAGKLLKLDEKKLVSAVGLAANQHTGVMEFFKEGTMEKRLFTGKSSHDGVLSAMLAANGFTASSTALDGENGFCRVFDRRASLSQLTSRLGQGFRLTDTAIKPHACCRLIHPQIDAALKIATEHDISPNDIDEVIVWGKKSAASSQHSFCDIPDVMAGQYSIQYCVATALLHRRVWVDDFTPRAIGDPVKQKLMRRIRVEHDEEMDRFRHMARVKIKLASGTTFTDVVHSARGSADDPAFRQEVSGKFRALASMVMPEAQVDSIERLVRDITRLGDVTELADALRSRE